MATVFRQTDPHLQRICDGHNALKTQIGAGAFYHLDASERTVTVADATDLPTALTLLSSILGVMAFHFADALALKTADVTGASLPAATAPVDLATAITAANTTKGIWNTHCGSTTYHYNADATNTVSAANATDLASLLTLIISQKAKMNAHMASAPTAPSFRLVSA